MIEIVTSLLIAVGVLFTVFGTLGLLRMPDVYNRLHAISKSSALGALCILAASVVFFSAYIPTFSLKQVGAMGFLFISTPIGVVMIARAAYLGGVPLTERTVRDDLTERRSSVSHHE